MDSYILQTALQHNGHNVTATAKALGTTRETLRYRSQDVAGDEANALTLHESSVDYGSSHAYGCSIPWPWATRCW